MSGYARLHRTLIDHPAFRNDAEAMAFAYMVLRAAWKPVRVRYKGKALNLERGQLAMSVRDLADAMDRDKGWVRSLLKRLRRGRLIHTARIPGPLVITVLDFETYGATNGDEPCPIGSLYRIQHMPDGREHITRDMRLAIFNRDGGMCRYCQSSGGPFHIDHVVPWAIGGVSDMSNLVLACAPCNLRKGAKSLEEMGWEL